MTPAILSTQYGPLYSRNLYLRVLSGSPNFLSLVDFQGALSIDSFHFAEGSACPVPTSMDVSLAGL